MKTASYFTFNGPGRIGISLGAPRGIKVGYRMFRKLAPTRGILDLDEPTYREAFFRDILGPLDPKQITRELHDLAGGFEPVLLCFEKPPFTPTNWCHRRMVAEWFQQELGLDGPEYGVTADLFR